MTIQEQLKAAVEVSLRGGSVSEFEFRFLVLSALLILLDDQSDAS